MSLSTTYTKTETDYLLQKLESELVSGLKGNLKISDTAPTAQGLYILSDVGAYTNLGGLVATADKLNYAYFDGTTWSLKAVEIPINYNTGELSQNLNPLRDTQAPSEKAVAGYVPKKLQSDNLLNLENVELNKFVGFHNVGNSYPNVVEPAEGRYTTQKIPIKPNTFYIKTLGSVCFFNSNNVMVSGYPNSTEEPILSDATASYAIFTGNMPDMEKTVFLEGKTLIKPQTGSPTIDKKILPPSVLSRKGNNLIISKLGGGDFRHINDAIDWLRNSGENHFLNPFTFEIIDGNYVESVNMIGLYLSLIGRNRENCIIRTYTNDYYNPPIDMAGNNHLSNLTIWADDDGRTTPVNGVGGLPAYGIHFDISGRLESLGIKVQGRSVVKNCRIIGMNQHAVGQGLWTNTESIWEDCEFFSVSNTAFRSHSYLPTGATGQKFLMRNCMLHNGGGEPPLVIQDANLAGGNENTDTVYSFQNNIAWNDLDSANSNDLFWGHDLVNGGTLSGKIKLGKDSFGNNIPKLNY